MALSSGIERHRAGSSGIEKVFPDQGILEKYEVLSIQSFRLGSSFLRLANSPLARCRPARMMRLEMQRWPRQFVSDGAPGVSNCLRLWL
jgi:hypothetical protein